MKDALKSLSASLAEELIAHIQSKGIQDVLAETKAADATDTGTFEVVITTENLDRYQEVIKLDGWDLTHYLANPVVLWGHDHSRLIGVCTSIDIRDGKMVAKGKFAPTTEGQEKRKLYELGFLKATSVGFIEKEREGNLITKAELLEFSFVSVPANPYALSLAMEKELNVNDLVTKGIMFVEQSEQAPQEAENAPESDDTAEDDAQDQEETDEAAEEQNEAQERDEERGFTAKQLEPVASALREALVALEALGTKSEEPEGDEAGEEEETDDEETRSFREFSEKRRLVQDAATILGDVLAEARQAIDARKSR